MRVVSWVRAQLSRLALTDFRVAQGPLVRQGLLQRAWPFVLAGLVARLVVWLPGTTITNSAALWAAQMTTFALLAATVLVPWRRLPTWTQPCIPFGFLAVIALLRESAGGVAGFAILVLLPVLWLALYGTGRQVVAAVVLSTMVFVVPVLVVGAPTYPASSLGRIALWPVTTAIVGASAYRLVTAERSRTALVSSLLSAATEQCIVATTADGTITVFNTGAERMFGYRAEDLIGRSTPLILHEMDEVAAQAARFGVPTGFAALVADAEHDAITREWDLHRRDGTQLRVQLSVTPIRDKAGAVVGYVAIGSDITERAASERLKEEFLALVSHELRTPLSSIIGYLELLSDAEAGPLTAQQRKYLEVVQRNARRQLRLVTDLLFVSQVEAGRVRLDLAEVDVSALAKSAVDSIQPQAAGAGVSVKLAADADAWLVGDADRIGQIFDNLLSNAIKFTPGGGEVRVQVAGEPEQVHIEVCDSGLGVPAAEQDGLFTRFFRSSVATGKAIPGVGLGLSIVRAIVEAHDGTVSASSTEGVGTSFRISLPRGGP